MNKLIITQNGNGEIGVLYPAPNCGIAIEEIARKDVPAGQPYLIVDGSAVPTDHTFFGAFEADFTQPHGHGIGAQAWFIEQYQAQIDAINAEAGPARFVEGQTDADYEAAVAHWSKDKAQRIAALNAQIAVQQAEMQA